MPYSEKTNHQIDSSDLLEATAITKPINSKYNLRESELRLKSAALFFGKYHEVVIQNSRLFIKKHKTSDGMEIDLNLKELVLTLKDLLDILLYKIHVAGSNEQVSLCIDALKVLLYRLNPKSLYFSELIVSLNKMPRLLEEFSLALAVLNSSVEPNVKNMVTKILTRLEALTSNTVALKDAEIEKIRSILLKFNKGKRAILNISLNNYTEAFAELKSDISGLNSRITYVESVTDRFGRVNLTSAKIILNTIADLWPIINENYVLTVNSLIVLKHISNALHIDYAEIMLTNALAKNIFTLFEQSEINPTYNYTHSLIEAIIIDLIQSLIIFKQSYDEHDLDQSRKCFNLTFHLLNVLDEKRIWQSSQNLTDAIKSYIKIASGEYKFKKDIQSGSFGKVSLYQQKDVSGKESHLALKTLKKQGDKQQREYLLNEIAALYILDHVNIISFAGIKIDTEEPFGLFLEYAKNRSLFDLLLPGKPQLSIGRVLNIALAIARAVAYIHKRGFIHCDIKTENILLKDDSGDVDSVKVADLGFVKNPATDGKQYRGTIVYLSPELARSWKSNTSEESKVGNTMASDVWAMAIVFAKLVRQSPKFPDFCRDSGSTCLWLASITTEANAAQYFKMHASKDLKELSALTNNCFSVFANRRPSAEHIQSKLECNMRLG